MSENFICSVKKLAPKESLKVAYWLYRLSEGIDSFVSREEFQGLYNALVHSLNLEKHSEKVVMAYISQAKKNKHLSVYKEPPKHVHPFDMHSEISMRFREDVDIYDRCGHWSTSNEADINLVRAVFASNENCFADIVAGTFFCKPNENRKTFTIPEDGYEIPESVFEAASDVSPVQMFIDAFRLNSEEGLLLTFIYQSHVIKELYQVCNILINEGEDSNSSLYSKCTGLSEKEVRMIYRSDKKLVAYGILNNHGDIDSDAIDCLNCGDLNTLFCDVLKEDKKNSYSLDSFSVKEEESELAIRLLKNSGSTNLLLYGAPGSGKTEFARSLVKQTGLTPYVYKNELELGEGENSENKALSRLNCLLSLYKKDSVIIVDEAESVLATGGISFLDMLMGGAGTSTKKGTVNTMLENSENKVIWILNYTNPLDESTLRRFTYSIRFNEMTKTMLKNIASSKLGKIKMSEVLREKLVDLCGKYHVTGASVDNIVKTVSGMNLKKTPECRVVSDVEKVLEANSALIFGKSKMRETVSSSYNLSVLNSSIPAEKIVRMVENAQAYAEKHESDRKNNGVRICLYGASGTGKTELARYLAERLGKKIILKRASDIMGKYVGENEKNIRAAFDEAEASGSILLFDEADSFFADRNGANTSWERTLVNEFLTQMEEYNGILICTTNLRKIMDPAMQRRFHIMAEFKPLTASGIKTLLKSYFGDWTFSEWDVAQLCKCDSVTPGDFGTVSSKIRFMEEEEIDASLIIDELCKIQDEKESCCRHIGFAS
ncbi:MAG: AAA family ATPase [Treponema sp.]|nr:AAA family ATPase [Treponema sp.]